MERLHSQLIRVPEDMICRMTPHEQRLPSRVFQRSTNAFSRLSISR